MSKGKNAKHVIEAEVVAIPRNRRGEPDEDIPDHIRRAIRAATLDNHRSIRQVMGFVFKCAIANHISSSTAWRLNQMLKDLSAALDREQDEVERGKLKAEAFAGLQVLITDQRKQ